MLWITYTLFGVLYFILLLISAKLTKRIISIPALIATAIGCSLATFVVLYIPLQINAPRTRQVASVKLSAISRPPKTLVYVIAVAVSGDGDTKKDAYIVNLEQEGFPSQGIFTEGEARISFEERTDGVIEKITTKLVGRALWFTADQPRDEYFIRVPMNSMERPSRIKEFW